MSLILPPSNGMAAGSITANGQAVTLAVPDGMSSSVFQLVNASFLGTVVFQSSNDGGQTYYNLRVYRGAGILNNLQTTLTNPPTGDWRGNVAAMSHVRVLCTAYTSGTLAVFVAASSGVGAVFLNAAIPIGQQSVGNTVSQSLAGAGAGAIWNGVYENMENVAGIGVNVKLSKVGILRVYRSKDGVTDESDFAQFDLAAGVAFPLTLNPALAQHFRLYVENTSGATGQLDVETTYRATATDFFRIALNAIMQLKDAILAPIVQSVLVLKVAVNNYVHAPGDTTNGLDVDVTRLPRPSSGPGRVYKTGAVAAQSTDSTLYVITAGKTLYVTSFGVTARNVDITSGGLLYLREGNAGGAIRLPLALPSAVTGQVAAAIEPTYSFSEPLRFTGDMFLDVAGGTLNYSAFFIGYEE